MFQSSSKYGPLRHFTSLKALNNKLKHEHINSAATQLTSLAFTQRDSNYLEGEELAICIYLMCIHTEMNTI